MTNTNQSLAAIIVVYNQSCTQSLTCRRLSALADQKLQIIIFDNSTRDFGNADFCREKGWTYLGGQGNLGLSKAYNTAIDYLKQEQFTGFFCLFDDDTDVTADYFSALRSAIAAGGQLFAPLIFAGGRLLSPCRITPGHVATAFDSAETALAYQGQDMTAINSAMAMDIALFQDYRYDENIFLDGIDHTHVKKMAEAGVALSVLDTRLQHQFSGDETPAKSSAVTRFRLFARDYAYIFRSCKRRYWLLVGKRALRLSLQYKSPVFLKILFQPKQEVV